MTNSKELFNDLVNRVQLEETRNEIQSIIYLLLEEKLGLRRVDIMMAKEIEGVKEDQFVEFIRRINCHEPIQYILGKAEFYGRPFHVNRSVLIPRPETELLIRAVLSESLVAPAILDVGTGSGCIAVTLALEIPQSNVYAIDNSEPALIIAEQNAKQFQTTVHFLKADALAGVHFDQQFDVIVSNPPYIAAREKTTMNANVLDYEPHQALFVSDDDPLIFYKAIANTGKLFLKPRGKIVVEINERLGQETAEAFGKAGYRATIGKDLDNKDRVLVADLF